MPTHRQRILEHLRKIAAHRTPYSSVAKTSTRRPFRDTMALRRINPRNMFVQQTSDPVPGSADSSVQPPTKPPWNSNRATEIARKQITL
jgi:hypothetical protein